VLYLENTFVTGFVSVCQLNVDMALTLLVRRQEGHPACKNWMLMCWWWRFGYSFSLQYFCPPDVSVQFCCRQISRCEQSISPELF